MVLPFKPHSQFFLRCMNLNYPKVRYNITTDFSRLRHTTVVLYSLGDDTLPISLFILLCSQYLFQPAIDRHNSNTTTCVFDKFPSSILKSIIDILLPLLTKIVNESLLTGTFPVESKTTVITPLIKK